MVDETAYRQVLRSTDPLACQFNKAIQAGCCLCQYSAKKYLAEREEVVCTDAVARTGCLMLHDLLRHNSAFTFKHIHDEEPLTHAQEMKLQSGGLAGLQQVMDGSAEVENVAALISAAAEKFGSLEDLPYSQIIQSVAAVKMRRRQDMD